MAAVASPGHCLTMYPSATRADKSNCQQVAGLLCVATRQVLWHTVQPWLLRQPGRHSLHCRVGRGEATYYRTAGNNEHTLTFGWKMVASKHDAAVARQWRTGREIVERGYFGGELTMPTLLAHTCCHEFAHLIQSIKGWIDRGSIHNAGFYRVLDRLHRAGAAQRVLEHLEHQADRAGIALNFIEGPAPPPLAPPAVFRPGELVSFDYRGQSVVGEVIRVNRKTVNVRPLRPRLAAAYFRISPQLLTARGGR